MKISLPVKLLWDQAGIRSQTWASYAAYLTYQYKMNEKFNIQAGARYNLYSMNCEFDTTFYPFPFTTADISDGALTGSLGLVYNPAEKWSIECKLFHGFPLSQCG